MSITGAGLPSFPLLERPAAYVVIYVLNGPPSSYFDLLKELNDCEGWLHYIDNVWIVLTHRTLVDIGSSLRQKIRTGDWLMVMPAKGPVDGWLPADAWTWLNKYLPREW
jgi:hypothetical protein